MTNNYNSLFQYLEKESISIDKNEFLFQIESHPEFPSLLSVADTLSFFGIKNGIIRVLFSDLEYLPNRFVSLLKEDKGNPDLYFIEKRGENVFSVIPTSGKGYVGKLEAPALNSGKIKIGQKVNIRLANFPDREFGILKGRIRNISLIPDKDGNLLIDVELPNGLETSYHKNIIFQQEMRGNAEIITEDLRLMERLLYQFRNVFRD